MSKGNSEKGYYSILQYVPNLERAESVNIGVVLFCFESKNFRIKISPSNNRIKQFFGNKIDIEHLNLFKLAFEERFQAASNNITTLESFQRFISTRGNQLQLTDPRPIKVFNPDEEIINLYNLLVCDIASNLLAQDNELEEVKAVVLRKAEIIKEFNSLLKVYKIEDKIIKNYTVNLKLFNEVTFPFAFRNGMTNVIKPVPFGALNVKENLKTACQLAVENDELNSLQDPIKLHVVASFRSDQPESINQISKVLETYHVELHSANNLEPFIQEIKEQAH